MADEDNKERQPNTGGRPSKYNSTMPALINIFIQKCEQDGNLPTHAGLAVFFDVCKATVELWAKEYPEFSDSLSKLNAKQEDKLINRGLKSEYNSTICKLILSSNHGYCERTDTTTAGEKIEPQCVSFLDAMTEAQPKPEQQAEQQDAPGQ